MNTPAALPRSARVDAGPLDRLPHGLQHQPLLRVHREGLARADAEEVRVELGGVRQESAVPQVGGAGGGGVVGEECVEVPAAVLGERVEHVLAGRDQPPQVLRRGHPAGVAAADAHDGDRLVARRRRAHDRCHVVGQAEDLGAQVGGEVGRGRVVEGDGRRHGEAGGPVQPGLQLQQGDRVEAEVPEGAVRVHRGRGRGRGCRVLRQVALLRPQYGERVLAHQAE